MGTQRSPELVEKIASATTFDNMKEGKAVKTEINPKLREQVVTLMFCRYFECNTHTR